jgi:hypothetical protein
MKYMSMIIIMMWTNSTSDISKEILNELFYMVDMDYNIV